MPSIATGRSAASLARRISSGSPAAWIRSTRPSCSHSTFAPRVLYVEGGIFNFGFAEADGEKLVYEVRDVSGQVREASKLILSAERP